MGIEEFRFPIVSSHNSFLIGRYLTFLYPCYNSGDRTITDISISGDTKSKHKHIRSIAGFSQQLFRLIVEPLTSYGIVTLFGVHV